MGVSRRLGSVCFSEYRRYAGVVPEWSEWSPFLNQPLGEGAVEMPPGTPPPPGNRRYKALFMTMVPRRNSL